MLPQLCAVSISRFPFGFVSLSAAELFLPLSFARSVYFLCVSTFAHLLCLQLSEFRRCSFPLPLPIQCVTLREVLLVVFVHGITMKYIHEHCISRGGENQFVLRDDVRRNIKFNFSNIFFCRALPVRFSLGCKDFGSVNRYYLKLPVFFTSDYPNVIIFTLCTLQAFRFFRPDANPANSLMKSFGAISQPSPFDRRSSQRRIRLET